jgi:hypothetical protein
VGRCDIPREPEWLTEIRDAKRHEPWTTEGPNRLVKVVRAATLMNVPQRARAVGYVTQEKYLFGKTPTEIERALGLPPFSLGRGCRIFCLQRLPQPSEYSYELSAAHPNGLAFVPADALEARQKYLDDGTLTEQPYYPPGESHIPQWDVSVAIALIHLRDLPPLFSYPRRSV